MNGAREEEQARARKSRDATGKEQVRSMTGKKQITAGR